VLRGRAQRSARALRRGRGGPLRGDACAGRRRCRERAAARRRDVPDRRGGAPRGRAAEDTRGAPRAGDLLGPPVGETLTRFSAQWSALPDYVHSTALILAVTVSLIILVALLTLWERKVIGWMQLRRGPNRVRIFGLLPGVGQPFADVFKLLLK